MKKTMKKIVAAVSAAVMCALPMAGAFGTTANAAGFEQKKTYRTYVDFTKQNNAQAAFRKMDFEFFSYTTLKMVNIERGNVGGAITAKHGSGSQTGSIHHRVWERNTLPRNGTVLVVYSDTSKDCRWSFDSLSLMRVKVQKKDGTTLSSMEIPEDSGAMYHSNGTITVETVLVGDVNSDGDVDVSDMVLLSRYNNGENVYINQRAADTDGNFTVDEADFDTLSDYVGRQYNFSDLHSN